MRVAGIAILLAFVSLKVFAQDTVQQAVSKPFKNFERQTSLLTLSFGCVDYNKQHYVMPDSSKYGAGSMSLPIYFKAERAIAANVSLAGSLAYNTYYYNYSLEGYGNGVTFYRPQTDKVRVLSPGLEVYYHFNRFIHHSNWDVFIGGGARASFVKHSNYPSTDTLSSTVKAEFTPTLRAGVRYYVNRNASFFGDVGYDKVSTFSLGFSYRLYGKILSL